MPQRMRRSVLSLLASVQAVTRRDISGNRYPALSLRKFSLMFIFLEVSVRIKGVKIVGPLYGEIE